jgi:hypothetical protein
MIHQRPAPGVQHRNEADLRPEVFRVGRDLLQALGGRPKQDGVQHLMIAQRQRPQFRRA